MLQYSFFIDARYCFVFDTQSQIIVEIANIKPIVCSLSELKQFIFSGTKHILHSKLNIVMTTDENCFHLRTCTITANSHTTELMELKDYDNLGLISA